MATLTIRNGDEITSYDARTWASKTDAELRGLGADVLFNLRDALFDRIAAISFELFARGTKVAAERGLILVDTKYEFGLVGDDVVLIDEVHTPDSSRFWYADTYEELLADGKDQRALDKEPLREWFVERGFRGEGPAPSMPDEVRVATASRYIALAEEITQRPFEATPQTARDRVASLLAP